MNEKSQGLRSDGRGGTCGGEQRAETSPLGGAERPVGLRWGLPPVLTHRGGAALSVQLVWGDAHVCWRRLRQGVSVVAEVRRQVAAGAQSHFSRLK